MFEKLIDVVLSFGAQLLPIYVIDAFDEGVLLRFGKFKYIAKPGLHWKIPFVDQVVTATIVTTTMHLNSQSLTTLDNKNIVLRAVVKYKVKDIEKFILEVMDSRDAIGDVAMGCIREVVMLREWDDLLKNPIDDIITKHVKTECRRWGVEIAKVTLTDLSITRSLRLFNESSFVDN
jgi:regulator of protease activity HflC (stomatin/prohibitin superfamily)